MSQPFVFGGLAGAPNVSSQSRLLVIRALNANVAYIDVFKTGTCSGCMGSILAATKLIQKFEWMERVEVDWLYLLVLVGWKK